MAGSRVLYFKLGVGRCSFDASTACLFQSYCIQARRRPRVRTSWVQTETLSLTQASTSSFVSPWSPETVTALPPQVQKLLEEFPSLLRPSAAPPKPLHSVVHHIDTGSAAPVFTRPWRLDPEKHRIAEEEFLALEKAGIIRRSNSPWASLLHLVPKKDGSWRPCSDYRRLNAVTIPDRCPLPNMKSLNDRVHSFLKN
jgi:hypothetical protein